MSGRKNQPEPVKATFRGPDPIFKPSRRNSTVLSHVPGADEEIRSPSKIPHGIKGGVPVQRKGSHRAGLITGIGALRPYTTVMIFGEDMPNPDDMYAVWTQFHALATPYAVIGPVEPIFTDGISKS
jgi:hypothetical protein